MMSSFPGKLRKMTLIILLSLFLCGNLLALDSTSEILLTSSSGKKISHQENVRFQPGKSEGISIQIFPEQTKQTLDGIGSSFTEASAFVLAHLEPEQRKQVMHNIYGESGANFSLTRTHIASCDFTVKGKYAYTAEKDDADLSSFSLHPDLEGFSKTEYPGIKDEKYDLLPMIKEAQAIKNSQKDSELRIIASAWTAPDWMKDIETWYINGTPENNWQGTGGSLKPEYEELYADYLIRYLEAYKQAGINIWGITPVNEPHGNNGQWESMHFTPETQNHFIKKYLGPKLEADGFDHVNLLIYDQNRDGLEHWTDIIFNDKETIPYLYGAAVHWYESTFKVYEDVFNRVHDKFPNMAIVHTEGCIDDLGKDAPNGVTDPIRFKEENWFDNDDFWWHDNATDWAYSVTWEGTNAADHPAYTPVHRYARNIIVSLDNWMTGWIDWNVVLDKNGGPNHVGNFCGAPIMIDTETQYVYYTPIYYVLAQFSRTMRPGDKAVHTSRVLEDLDKDTLHACATINADNIVSVQVLNTSREAISYKLQIADQFAEIKIEANAVQTVRVQL
jgi:glucosylceramidase